MWMRNHSMTSVGWNDDSVLGQQSRPAIRFLAVSAPPSKSTISNIFLIRNGWSVFISQGIPYDCHGPASSSFHYVNESLSAPWITPYFTCNDWAVSKHGLVLRKCYSRIMSVQNCPAIARNNDAILGQDSRFAIGFPSLSAAPSISTASIIFVIRGRWSVLIP